MESPEEIAARFDERAPHYDESAMHRRLAAAVAAFVDTIGVRDALDVATGTGLVLRALPLATGSTATGVDISDGMLAIARASLPGTRFLRADAAHLPFDDAGFDLVTCVTALHLFPDATAALAEWRRVLRAGGRIVLATFAVDDAATGRRAETRIGHGSSPEEAHTRFGTPAAVERFAATAGLRLSRSEAWAHPPAGDPDDVCLLSELSHA